MRFYHPTDAEFVHVNTVEPCYNEDLGTIKITLLYQVCHYIRVKEQRNIELGPVKVLCYIQPFYNKVPLYNVNSVVSIP